jgi:uncharacterized protein (TIGR00255 family)
MAVYSMTGFASAQYRDDPANPSQQRLGLEIRSVNSRFLDLTFKLPEELRHHEPALRECLTARLKRGKVEVRANIEHQGGETLPEPSVRMLQRLGHLQDQIKAWIPDAVAPSVMDIVRLSNGQSAHPTDWTTAVVSLADTVLAQLAEARAREGERLCTMLHDRIAQLRALAAQAGPLIPKLVEQQRQRFLDRWKDAMALADGHTLPEAAQDRALTEATAFAIRIDVAEELTRLSAHLDEIERLLQAGGELGKRLDFLIQELHREANTLGSKSATLELTRISVDMKVRIEQMREQVQNIE